MGPDIEATSVALAAWAESSRVHQVIANRSVPRDAASTTAIVHGEMSLLDHLPERSDRGYARRAGRLPNR